MSQEIISATRRRTDKIIRESFISLISEKPLEKITVRDLCQRADINRATFYRYYTDLYALMDAVADDFFHRLFTEIAEKGTEAKENTTYSTLSLYIHDALDIIEKEKELCKVLLPSQTKSSFAELLTKSIYDICAITESFTEYRHLQLMYMTNGMLSVIEYWLSTDCNIDPEPIAQIILDGVQHTLFQHD